MYKTVGGQTQTTTYEYDYENRLTKVTLPNTTTNEFVYDGDLRRISSKNAAGVTTKFLCDGLNNLKDYAADGSTVLASYTQGIGIDKLICRTDTNGPRYFHADALGSTRLMTDEDEETAATYTYDAWGKLTSTPNQNDGNKFKFTAREFEDEIGLQYNRARFYDPETGRFITQDPLTGGPDDPSIGYKNNIYAGIDRVVNQYMESFDLHRRTNRYVYCYNNPLNSIDPLGLFSWSGFGQGAWDIVSEPVKAASDTFVLAPMIAVNNAISDTNIALEDVQYNSSLASGTQGRMLGGDSGLAATAKGYGELGLAVGTAGIYSLGKNIGENLGYYSAGAISAEKLDYNLSRGAGAQVTAAIAGVASKAAGRGSETKPATSGLKETGGAVERASEIHKVLDPRAQRARTTAVIETEEGTRVVSSSTRRLTPAQRAQLQPGEVEGVGSGHAEITGVNAARAKGLTPTGAAASRPICADCAHNMEAQGVKPLSPLREE
jgi:RHS repeat-associated protein